MSDERSRHDADDEYEEVEEPRSIFSALWFRAVLAVAALGVVAAIAVPYVLEFTRPAPPPIKAPPAPTARVTPRTDR